MAIATVDREELARQALPLVSHCVAGVSARVPRHVPHEDLVSAGMFGLAQAAQSWDPERGVSFDHYARQRINGALLDELRARDWASRGARREGRAVHRATEDLTARLGRTPEATEVATEMGISADDVARARADVERATVLQLDALAPGGEVALAGEPAADPSQQLLAQEMQGYLHEAVLALPERLRKVMVEYFFEDRPMQDIAADLGITVSRVSQLRAQAIELMREGISAQYESEPIEAATLPRGRAERKRAQYAATIAASSVATRLASSPTGFLTRVAQAG